MTGISGKVALLRWTDGGDSCPSTQRAANIQAAGATGFIVTEDGDALGTINGSATRPGIIISKTAGDEIRAAIAGAQTVSVTGTSASDFEYLIPALDDQLASFSSRGSRRAGNVKPDVAAVGGSVFSAAVGSGNLGRDSSGTSMAAPMVAGLAALVRHERPTWNAEQVKANIMNTAGGDIDTNGSTVGGGDRYGPNRVGAGRIDAEAALANEVVAYVTDDDGAVSVSFGPVEVTGPTSISKAVTVENTGSTPATYATSYDAITSVPGVAVDVSPATVAVAAAGTASVTVTLRVDNAAALTKTVDPTHGRSGTDLFEYLADASGNLLLTPSSGSAPQLRVPVYAAPRPASVMSQPASVSIGANGAGTLALQGSGVDQGAGVERVRSLAFGMELQATSGVAPSCGGLVTTLCTTQAVDKAADLRYVGVTADGSQAYFGLATHGPWSTPEGRLSVEVYLDVDRDGTTDARLYNYRDPDTDTVVAVYTPAGTTDIYTAGGIDNRYGDVDAALFDSDVMVLPIPLSVLGVNASRPRINYGIRTFSDGYLIDQAGIGSDGRPNGSLTANLHQPGLRATGEGVPGGELDRNSTTTGPLLLDSAGKNVKVVRNATSYAQDSGQGLLMLHLHNKAGSKAQVVALAKAKPAVTLTATPPTVAWGGSTSLAVSVTDPDGQGTPTGTVTVRNAGGAVVATGPVAGGAATFSYRPTTAGTQQLVATYDGDALFASVASAPVSLTVNPPPAAGKAAAVLTLKLPRAAVLGTKVRASVAIATVGGRPATGTVTLKNGKKSVGRAKLKNGKAVVTVRAKPKGKLTLVATYAGDASYQAGTSKAVTIKIRPKSKKKKR